MALTQSNTTKVNKPLNADAFIGVHKDVSAVQSFSVQVYVEGAVAPLTGVVQVLGSNTGGGLAKYKVLKTIPINVLGDNSFFEFFDGGEASVRYLGFNYVSGGAGIGTIKDITIFGKQ